MIIAMPFELGTSTEWSATDTKLKVVLLILNNALHSILYFVALELIRI